MDPNSDSDAFFLSEAYAEAVLAGADGEVPVGAVLVHHETIVARGRNQREKTLSPISHAEIHALVAGSESLKSWRLLGCTLYVTLEPCPMCLAACQQARISRVVYGAADPKGGALSLGYPLHADQRMNHRFIVDYQETHQCGQILTDFFRRKRNSE
ncbi:MAG: nucleoside deaminase [Cryobacterium sp.]|nr:nucleoside deaminase [Oligoflexia bacterium]